MQNNAGFINMNQGIYNQNKNNNNIGMGMDINNFNINNNNIEAPFNYGGISNNGQINQMNNRYNMSPQVTMNPIPNVNVNHSFIQNNQINKNVNMTNNINNNVSQRLFNSQTYLTGIHMNQNQNQRLNTVTMQNQNQNQILNALPLQNQNQNQILNSSAIQNQNQNQNQNQMVNAFPMQNQNQNQMVNAFPMQNQNQNQMLNVFPMNKQTSMQEVLFKKNLNYNNLNFVNQNQNNNINAINNQMNIPYPNVQNNLINFQQNQQNQFLNLNQLNGPILNPNPNPAQPPVKRQGGMKAILPRNIVSIDAPHKDQNTEIRNLKFDASTGIRIVIKVPIYTTVEKALEEFVKRIGLNKDVIGKDLIFLFNGSQMDIHSQELVENYQDLCSITVFDKNNVIGAY